MISLIFSSTYPTELQLWKASGKWYVDGMERLIRCTRFETGVYGNQKIYRELWVDLSLNRREPVRAGVIDGGYALRDSVKSSAGTRHQLFFFL